MDQRLDMFATMWDEYCGYENLYASLYGWNRIDSSAKNMLEETRKDLEKENKELKSHWIILMLNKHFMMRSLKVNDLITHL